MKGGSATYREVGLLMLCQVPYAPIDNHPLRAQILGPGGHQAAPAGRVQALGLLDVHDGAGAVAVGEVARRARRGAVRGEHHAHRHGRAGDARGRRRAQAGRVHVQARQEAASRVVQLDEGVADLGGVCVSGCGVGVGRD